MRGMLYFEMVRLWGPEYDENTRSKPAIPLILKTISTIDEIVTPTLAELENVFNFIEKDLLKASTLLLPYGKNGIRLSYYACQATLMRLSMHKGDYKLAEGYANNILDKSSGFQLAPSPFEAFNNFQNSSEDIFAIQQTLINNTGDITTGTGLTYFYSSIIGKGVGAFRVQSGSFSASNLNNRPSFESIDKRGMRQTDIDSMSIVDEVEKAFYRNAINTKTFSPSKYLSADRVIPVIRLAEIYLARAESITVQASAVTQAALDDLNAVRIRAGLEALELIAFSNFGFDGLMDSIKTEKKREFLYEGLIFHDLKRWNDGIGIPSVQATDEKFILPIPQSECDASPGLCQ